MKYLQQFLLILCISFVGEFLKICIAVTDSGKYLRNGHFVYRAVDRTDQTGAGKGRGEVPDRDHACYVHSGGCWADGVLGNVENRLYCLSVSLLLSRS